MNHLSWIFVNFGLLVIMIIQAALSLLDSLHCWSLLESESFLWLVATFYDQSESSINLDQSEERNRSQIIINPNRCGPKNTNYVFFRRSATPSTESVNPDSKCFYFTGSERAIEPEVTNWEECNSCDQCPPSLFFKIEKNAGGQSLEISKIHLAVGIAVTILLMLAIIIIITR